MLEIRSTQQNGTVGLDLAFQEEFFQSKIDFSGRNLTQETLKIQFGLLRIFS